MLSIEPLALPQKVGYDSPVSDQNRDRELGSPLHPYDESRRTHAVTAAFLSAPPFFGGSDGEPKGSPFPARGARSSYPFEPPPLSGSHGVGFSKPHPLEANMAQSLPAFAIGEIAIRQHDGLFSLNDLHAASGGAAKHQPALFARRAATRALAQEIGASTVSQTPMQVVNDGKNNGTFACRELVIAYAAWISAKFHLKVIRVFLDAVQPQRPYNPAIDYDRISPAQAQDLKELVHAIVDSKVQGFAETWARLQRKFRVNSYLELPATRFDEARDYLQGKLPQAPAVLPAPAPDAVAVPTLLGRRWLIATSMDGKESVRPIANSAMVVSPEDLPGRIEQGDFLASDLLLARIASAVAHKQGQRAMRREQQALNA